MGGYWCCQRPRAQIQKFLPRPRRPQITKRALEFDLFDKSEFRQENLLKKKMEKEEKTWRFVLWFKNGHNATGEEGGVSIELLSAPQSGSSLGPTSRLLTTFLFVFS